MRIYLAVPQPLALKAYLTLFPDAQLNIITTFARRNQHEGSFYYENSHLFDSMILDSGVWSLNQNPQKHQGKITLPGYISYIKIHCEKLDFYFNFDADFSKQGFEENFVSQLAIEAAGLHPVPVVHDLAGEEPQFYLNRGHKLVAIGSGELAFESVERLEKLMLPFFRAGVKVHFLGCTSYKKLANLPISSCDSSSWTQAASRDYVIFWNPELLGEDKTDKVFLAKNPIKKMKNRHYLDHKFLITFENYLDSELSLTLDDIIGRDKKSMLCRQIVNIYHFQKMQKMVTENHRKLGFLT